MRKFVRIVSVAIGMLGLALPATADRPSAEEQAEANPLVGAPVVGVGAPVVGVGAPVVGVGAPVVGVGASVVGQEGMAGPEGTVEDDASAGHASAKHDFHVNHFGGFIGASTHMDSEDTAFTIGLEYARQFSQRWAVALYLELSSSDLERDVIVVVGGVFYPVARVALVMAPGVAQVNKDVEHHGKLEQEAETEFLLRLGAAYGFPLNSQAAIAPTVFADRGADQWTVVYGVSMVVGF